MRYYDTMVFDEKQLEHLWGTDHVVIGTDYPYDMGYYKPVDFVERTASLSRAEGSDSGGMRRSCWG